MKRTILCSGEAHVREQVGVRFPWEARWCVSRTLLHYIPGHNTQFGRLGSLCLQADLGTYKIFSILSQLALCPRNPGDWGQHAFRH